MSAHNITPTKDKCVAVLGCHNFRVHRIGVCGMLTSELERGQENAAAIVIHCLLCLEVLLRSRVNYTELSKLSY